MTSIGNFLRNVVPLQSMTKEELSELTYSAMESYFNFVRQPGFNFMVEDWDNCIIIDACRYDVFKRRNTIPGTLEPRLSSGSSTFEVFEANLLDTNHHDTVYVTANPVPRVDKWCAVDLDAMFHDVVDVWAKHWDDDLNTVPLQPVETAIRRAQSTYPNKRILGHFIQPHQPFIGEVGQQIDEPGMRAHDYLTDREDDGRKNVWEQLKTGDLNRRLVWTAYRENFDIVLPHVESLCMTLPGKTVVTSDHGNMIGEFAWPFPLRQYGHPAGIHTKILVTVPWLVIESSSRRKVVSEPPIRSGDTPNEEVKLDRLEALGYR